MAELTSERDTSIVRIQSAIRGWLARRGCAVLAQQVYQQCHDETTDRDYYWNARTGQVSWSVPWMPDPKALAKRAVVRQMPDRHESPARLSAENDLPSSHPTTTSVTHSERDDKEFLLRCTQEKRLLFEAHRRAAMRSVRRWEQQQMREKSEARAHRLIKMHTDNHERLTDLQHGAKTYNLKSIRQAAVQGDVGRLTELLNLGFDADASSAMGLTPLLGASQSGCLDAVRILLQRGADVNHQHVKTRRTALMEASARENPEVVRELLRHGAKLEVQDAHGETANDSATDALIRRYLTLAASRWSHEGADVFPIPFRSAGKTLFLVQKRQDSQWVERRTMMRRELAALRPTLLRSAAEAKMRYDDQVRASHGQVTLVGKVQVLQRADRQFDDDRGHLLRTIERALLSKADAERPTVLPSSSIDIILAFCDRHWFDVYLDHNRKRKPRRGHHSEKPKPVAPIKTRAGFQAVPAEIKVEWSNVQTALQERCEDVRRAQLEERPDVDNGVTRGKDGQTLSTLQVCVVEAQHLPYRDPRVHDPIDPLVRLTLRDRVDDCPSASTDIRLSDRHPTWNADFSFSVESTKGDLLIQLVDAKRKEVAGEVTVALRTLLDQKQHEEWLVLPPTLRQQTLERSPREHAARIRLTLRLEHTPSLLLTRELQHLVTVRADVLRRKFALMQNMLEQCIQKLTMA